MYVGCPPSPARSPAQEPRSRENSQAIVAVGTGTAPGPVPAADDTRYWTCTGTCSDTNPRHTSPIELPGPCYFLLFEFQRTTAREMAAATEPARADPAPKLNPRAVKRAPLQPVRGNALNAPPQQSAPKYRHGKSRRSTGIATQSNTDAALPLAGNASPSFYVITDSDLPGGEWSTRSWKNSWPGHFDGRARKRYESRMARAARQVAEAAVEPCPPVLDRDEQVLSFVRLLRMRIGDERTVGLLNTLWMRGKLSDTDLLRIRNAIRDGLLDDEAGKAGGPVGDGGAERAHGDRRHKRRTRAKQREVAQTESEKAQPLRETTRSRRQAGSRSHKRSSGKAKAIRV